jgi:hypothetical protein
MLSTRRARRPGPAAFPRPKWCALWALRAGRFGTVDERSTEDLRNEDKHPFGRCVDVEHSQSISLRERGTTSQAFYRNGTKWRLEDQRGNCEEPVCRLLKPRLSMSIPFGRGKSYRSKNRSIALSTRDGAKRRVRAGQIGHAVKLRIVGHALENVYAEILECDAGARHNILDGARDDDVVRTSKTRHPRCDVYCDAPDVVAGNFDFAGVNTCANL